MHRRWMGSYCVSGEGTHRDHEILSGPTSCLFGPAESTSRAHSATVLRQRHGADRAPARAARNGCAASKTRLTTCEAQTAMASSHRAASWIEARRTAQPNRRRRGHCSSTAGLLSRPGPAWHRCLRDCSGEFIRACLAGEASVHLPARVAPLLLRGISR